MTSKALVHVPDDVLYRYEEQAYSNGLDEYDEPLPGHTMRVNLDTYKVLKRTPKGAWIDGYFANADGFRKFVLLTAKKQFASNTKEEALNCFVKRKEKQIQILTGRLKDAEECLAKAKTGDVQLRQWSWYS